MLSSMSESWSGSVGMGEMRLKMQNIFQEEKKHNIFAQFSAGWLVICLLVTWELGGLRLGK